MAAGQALATPRCPHKAARRSIGDLNCRCPLLETDKYHVNDSEEYCSGSLVLDLCVDDPPKTREVDILEGEIIGSLPRERGGYCYESEEIVCYCSGTVRLHILTTQQIGVFRCLD